MTENEPENPARQSQAQYRALRLASLLVNALTFAIVGTGLMAILGLWLQKESGVSLETGQFRQLMAMIFFIIMLSAYVVLEYFQHRREQREAKAARAAKARKKPRRPEPQFEPIFAEPVPPTASGAAPLVPAEAAAAIAAAGDVTEETSTPFGAHIEPAAAAVSAAQPVNDAAMDLFTQTVNAAMAGLDERVSAFAEFGLHLFVMGGCGEFVRRNALAPAQGKVLLTRMLNDIGLSKRSAAGFAENANTFAQVANFRCAIDAGYRAMAHLQDTGVLNVPELLAVLAEWGLQEGICQPPDVMTFVATAVAAGVNTVPEDRQRVLRAHAKAVGDVLAQFQGREIANLGSGVIAAFTDAATAVRAAEAIQGNLDFFVRENPALIVTPRVGVDTEMAATVNDVYVSAGTARAATIAALTPAHRIYCSEPTCDDCADIFEFSAVPPEEAYGDLPPLFEARWSRAPAEGGPALEYRQLGVLNDINPALAPSP